MKFFKIEPLIYKNAFDTKIVTRVIYMRHLYKDQDTERWCVGGWNVSHWLVDRGPFQNSKVEVPPSHARHASADPRPSSQTRPQARVVAEIHVQADNITFFWEKSIWTGCWYHYEQHKNIFYFHYSFFFLPQYSSQTMNRKNSFLSFICTVFPISSTDLCLYWILAQVKLLVIAKRSKEASAKIEVWLEEHFTWLFQNIHTFTFSHTHTHTHTHRERTHVPSVTHTRHTNKSSPHIKGSKPLHH